ncbi:DUF4424 family protein [uncultured Haemophilus sp.]|uniref:DUF4424 family protein n=1 Tax=uncultured Haemophilus sp. TaxID=237779 RepID=UPI002803E94E|nr:DUF4424 family protein [uncultured Haemophilus sp.]
MKKSLIFAALCVPFATQANDSVGTVSTGGVEYIKNEHIAMQKENLFISQKQIKVEYEYRNLTDQDITETVLFPLPEVMLGDYGDFADTQSLINSFKIYADGKEIKPQTHVRAFFYETQHADNGEKKELISHDVTDILRACGLTEQELMEPWLRKSTVADKKILQCQDPRLAKFNYKDSDGDDNVIWGGQIIYSWPQTFKANAITTIHHEYAPLVGGGMWLSGLINFTDFADKFCTDAAFKRAVKAKESQGIYYRELGYILKTGANWAKPIADFTLTIEKPKNQLVSFCWKGQGEVKKVLQNDKVVQFQVKEKDFLPKHNLDVIYGIDPKYFD